MQFCLPEGGASRRDTFPEVACGGEVSLVARGYIGGLSQGNSIRSEGSYILCGGGGGGGGDGIHGAW